MLTHKRGIYNGVLLVDRPAPANVKRLDHGVLPMLGAMEGNGMYISAERIEALHAVLVTEMGALAALAEKQTGYSFNIGSGDQLADVLFHKMGLKQPGKQRKTPSGVRLAVDSDILKGMIAQHPAISTILDWKEREKLRSTYTHTLLAQQDKNGRVHPEIIHTGPETGRLACKNPNLQNIPTRTALGKLIRKAFVSNKGEVIGSADMCLHPDTLVKSVYGDKRIADLKIGEPVLTYRERRISHGKVTTKKVIGQRVSYKLTFDNGESVIASQEHRWPVYDPEKKSGLGGTILLTTEQLVVGQRMVPCREGMAGVPGQERLTWYSRSNREYEPQHRLIAEAVYGPRPKGCDIHHKDEDYLNNHPDNLEYKDSHVHKSEHAKKNYAVQDHAFRIKQLRKGIKRRRKYHGTANPNSKLTEDQHTEIAQLASEGMSASQIAPKFGISYGYARELVVRHLKGRNHKLVKKQLIGLQPMYAITVEPDHNYVLACGIVTQNSQVEMRHAAEDARCPALMKVFTDKKDLYWDVAEGIYEREFTKEDRNGGINPDSGLTYKEDNRQNAKVIALATIYDVSPPGLVDQMLVYKATRFLTGGDPVWDYDKYYKSAVDKCAEAIKKFYLKYPELLESQRKHHKRAKKFGLVWDMFGRWRWIPQVYSVHRWIVSEGLRAAANMPVQAPCAGILKLWLAILYDRIEEQWGEYGLKPLMTVHDEILVSGGKWVVEDFLAEAAAILSELMPSRLYTTPLKASWATAESWGDIAK